MNLYIDCEWNSFDKETGLAGELISMALVSDTGEEFYEVLQCENPEPWVAANVMPVLNKEPISKGLFTRRLDNFISGLGPFTLVADWPEDISKFCNALIIGPGERLNTPPFTMQITRVDAPSQIPHNALADAQGLAALMINLASPQ